MTDSGDKKNENPDDEPLFGDDDFGDFDDFDDDGWEDDVTDSPSAPEIIENPSEEAVGPDPFTSFDDFEDEEGEGDFAFEATSGAQQKKTFLQKYFTVIVGLIIFLFGGLWFLAQGGNDDTPKQQGDAGVAQGTAAGEVAPNANADSDLVDKGTLPPQPAPFQTDSLPDGTLQSPESEAANRSAASANDVLTPLPEASEKARELVDLDAVLKAPAEIRDSAPIAEIEEEILVSAPEDMGADKTEPQVLQADFETKKTDAGDTSIEKSLDSLEVLPAVSDQTNNSDAEQNALMAENKALLKEIADNKAQLDALKQELKAIQMRVATSQKELELADSVEPEQPFVERITRVETSPVTTKDAAKTAKSAVKPRVITPKQATNWVLRSASPGRATIAEKGSNDLINVEKGSNIKGLGRITSIEVENGKWFVRGTTGYVSR